MMYTPFNSLTDEELLAHVWNKREVPTALEIELAHRLTAHIEEEQTCSALEGVVTPVRVGGVTNDA